MSEETLRDVLIEYIGKDCGIPERVENIVIYSGNLDSSMKMEITDPLILRTYLEIIYMGFYSSNIQNKEDGLAPIKVIKVLEKCIEEEEV